MAQKLRLNNKENQNEIAFKKLHEFVDQITNEYNVTRQTLRNWILKSKYPKKVDEIKAAQMQINKTNWDLVSALVYALKEADKWAENNQDIINQAKTEEDK